MHIFYQPDLTLNQLALSEEESKHCVRVLRMKRGDEVQLVDGKGTLATALVIDDHVKKCVLEIGLRKLQNPIRPYYLHIAVAPTKSFDRMEWFIEKAVETGIDEISFMICENSERDKVNLERCEKIAVSAMKQSKQYWLPKINTPVKMDELLSRKSTGEYRFIAWCETGTDHKLPAHSFTSSSRHFTMLIGPEGDFTKTEAERAIANGFAPVSFGANRLRTETAALYACMAINVLHS